MKFKAKVLGIHFYTESAFFIRFERKGLLFKTGQYLILSLPGSPECREYSIASGVNEKWLEILAREVEGGSFSFHLKKIKVGDILEIDGPYGFFILREDEIQTKEFILIGTGTGISPFQSFIRTYPNLYYHLIHGVRYFEESYGNKLFPILNKTICTSQDKKGNFSGRVTGFLKEVETDPDKIYYLCGNSQMINEVIEILEDAGVPPRNIRSEVFF